jgi:tetratricopeptide (TPR) repeat protein/class 3 adenylate cyclase
MSKSTIVRIEDISVRRCRACGWKGPGYLDTCIKCAAAMGEVFLEKVAIVTPMLHEKKPPKLFLPIAVLALELSLPEWLMHNGRSKQAEGIVRDVAKVANAVVMSQSGVLTIIFAKESLHESVNLAACVAERLRSSHTRENLEIRIGLAHGILDGRETEKSATVRLAERLARAAGPNQTLVTLAISKELRNEWDFAPVGVLPRREQDKTEIVVLFNGRKTPAPTCSALEVDDGSSLVGRLPELEAISSELQIVVDTGATRWCAVVAPAGGGKSKLLRTWLSMIRGNDNLMMLSAACSSFGARPFSVVENILRSLERGLPFGLSRDEASHLLVSALQTVNQTKTVVVLIEDLHWADQSSLQVLKSIVETELPNCFFIVALRTSFLRSVSWLRKDRTRFLHLPGLSEEERESLAYKLLPEPEFRGIANRLATSRLSANPLYLEQSAAFMFESGDASRIPRSLHEAVLKRLELLLEKSKKIGYSFDPASELEEIELKIGEWLDRLETEDYEGRMALAKYLGLLQAIDVQLVVLKSIYGIQLLRNRRLSDSIDRFYSASFAENAEMIKTLARKGVFSATYAAERGAYRASEDLRLKDLIGYLALAKRYATEETKRASISIQLGDAYVCSGRLVQAQRAYELALESSFEDPRRLASCEQRVGHISMLVKEWQRAIDFLEKAKLHAEGDERFIATCDHAFVVAIRESVTNAENELNDLLNGTPHSYKLLRYFRKTKVRMACRNFEGSSIDDPMSRKEIAEYANAFVFEMGEFDEIADFVDAVNRVAQNHPKIVCQKLVEAGNLAEKILRA